jgi:hypothetical protein
MKLLTREIKARTVFKRWIKQYPIDRADDDNITIGNQIQDLGDNPDPDAIDKIIGNKAWTEPGECSHCEKSPEILISFNTAYDGSFKLCPECIKTAHTLIAGARGEEV